MLSKSLPVSVRVGVVVVKRSSSGLVSSALLKEKQILSPHQETRGWRFGSSRIKNKQRICLRELLGLKTATRMSLHDGTYSFIYWTITWWEGDLWACTEPIYPVGPSPIWEQRLCLWVTRLQRPDAVGRLYCCWWQTASRLIWAKTRYQFTQNREGGWKILLQGCWFLCFVFFLVYQHFNEWINE